MSASRIISRITQLLLFAFVLSVVATARAENLLSPKAKQHFDAGIAYVDDPAGEKLEEAYREFKIAYDDSPTYLILANIGYCALALERDEEAIQAYEGYLAKATTKDIPPKKRTLMERDVAMLKASLVRATYKASPKVVNITDERIPAKGVAIVNRYQVTTGHLGLGIHPGHHRITATADGYEPQTWELDADSASIHDHEFALKPNATATAAKLDNATSQSSPSATQAPRDVTAPPQTPRRKPMTAVYIGAATTGLFAVSATVTGLLVLSKKSEFNDVNRDGMQPAKARDLAKDGKLFAALTDVALGAAIVSAGATAYFYFSAAPSSPEAPAPLARLRLEPTLGYSTAGLTLSGKF